MIPPMRICTAFWYLLLLSAQNVANTSAKGREDCERGVCVDTQLLELGEAVAIARRKASDVSDAVGADLKKCVGDAQHPEAWNRTLKNTAFIVGGMGKYGRVPGLRKCLALAETIGRIGGWQGRVYVMTDELPDQHTRESVAKGFSNIHFRKVEPIRDGVDFRQFSAGGGGGYLKTQIFDLPDVPEDILIWHDCDKMIAQPDCINKLFAEASLDFGPDTHLLLGDMPSVVPCPNKDQRPGTTVDGVYCEIDHCRKGHDRFADRCGDGVHVGVFAAHRQWSKPLIDEWKQRQQIEPNTYDRYTFYDAWKHVGAKVSAVPAPFRDNMWAKGVNQCVNHMSGPRVWDEKNRGGLEPFLQSVCLKSMSYEDIFQVYASILKWNDKTGDVVFERRY